MFRITFLPKEKSTAKTPSKNKVADEPCHYDRPASRVSAAQEGGPMLSVDGYGAQLTLSAALVGCPMSWKWTGGAADTVDRRKPGMSNIC